MGVSDAVEGLAVWPIESVRAWAGELVRDGFTEERLDQGGGDRAGYETPPRAPRVLPLPVRLEVDDAGQAPFQRARQDLCQDDSADYVEGPGWMCRERVTRGSGRTTTWQACKGSQPDPRAACRRPIGAFRPWSRHCLRCRGRDIGPEGGGQ